MYKRRKRKEKQCKFCGKTFFTLTNANFCSRECANKWRKWFSRKSTGTKKGGDTLCWDCAKATAGSDCPWANEFKPVEGWDAKKTERIERGGHRNYKNERVVTSFIVKKCPLFVEG